MNYLKSLLIQDYKGFYGENKIEFAIPDPDASKKGLNVIVGPNNTGKTTILESLMLIKDTERKRFNVEDKHGTDIPKIIAENESGLVCELIAEGSLIKEQKDRIPEIHLLTSSSHWSSNVLSEVQEYYFIDGENKCSLRDNSNSSLSGYLCEICKDHAKKEKFNQMMKQIFPNFSDWGIDSSNNKDYIYYQTGNGNKHITDHLGKGVLRIFLICAHLSILNNSILLIDEPELALHPQIQKNLSFVLSEAAKTRQIIICTHSPYFINWEDYLNGAKFIRLNKHEDKTCSIHQLSEPSKYNIEGHIEDRHKPALLDIVAKEIFFGERFLFVEGQEDVALIKRFLKKGGISLNYELFGYGVGGYKNIEKFLKLAYDLGIEKAGALYDGDVPSEYYRNIKEKFPKYIFQKLKTYDIRDKDPIYTKFGEIKKRLKIDYLIRKEI